MSTNNAPFARTDHTAVWSGTEMLVWGGDNQTTNLNTGGRYNPVTDTWQTMTTANAPSARFGQTAVWTGTRMIVWGGGTDFYTNVNSGGLYNPSLNAWTN